MKAPESEQSPSAWHLRPPPVVITSMNNPAIKRIRRLRLRKERGQSGLCFIEGVRFVMAALQQGAEIETLVVAAGVETPPYLAQALRSGLPTLSVSPEVLQALAEREDAQGIGAVVRQRWERLSEVQPDRGLGWVALDRIQYPGNLGTILRACDAVGMNGVILLGETSDPYDPLAVRASMGALFYQRLVRARYEEFLAWKTRHRLPVIGTSPAAELDYRQLTFPVPCVLLMGCESVGLSEEQRMACDQVARIPMAGQCDSLNVALATGILLYALYHQANR